MIDPALGDGLQDATDAIEIELAQITAPRRDIPNETWLHGGVLEFSSGVYRITRTIELPSGYGFTMKGAGVATRPPSKGILDRGGPWIHNEYPFLATAILWDGPIGQPMFTYGGEGGSFDRLSWWGGGAEAGIHFRNPVRRDQKRPGIASGHTTFGHVSFAALKNGIKCGVEYYDGNIGDFTYNHIEFYKCGTGIHVMNSMSMNHSLVYCQTSACGTAFDFESGGKFACQLFSAEGTDTILRTGRQGNGNEAFYFSSICLDSGTKQMPKIIHQTSNNDLTVIIGNLHCPIALKNKPRADGDAVFDLKPRGRCRLISGQYLRLEDWVDVPGLKAEFVRY